tara:strand:+ start:661 stop:783 length:123 start_codon:yes stop_codon:yes gene_type:complete
LNNYLKYKVIAPDYLKKHKLNLNDFLKAIAKLTGMIHAGS